MRWVVTLGARTVHLDPAQQPPTLEQKAVGVWSVVLDGQTCALTLLPEGEGSMTLWWRGQRYGVRVEREAVFALRQHFSVKQEDASAGHTVKAHMPGLVTQVKVERGQHVGRGAGVIVIEAMKMENEVSAPVAGVVEAVDVLAGDQVEKGQRLCVIRPENAKDG